MSQESANRFRSHSGARASANPESNRMHPIRVWIPGSAFGRPGMTIEFGVSRAAGRHDRVEAL